jgi:hypothetical protein
MGLPRQAAMTCLDQKISAARAQPKSFGPRLMVHDDAVSKKGQY